MSFNSRLLAYLDKQSRPFLWLAVLVSVLGLGIIDYETGPDISIFLFYIIPVALASWTLGMSEGFLVSLVCAAVSGGTNLLTGERFSDPIYLWNTAGFLAFLFNYFFTIRRGPQAIKEQIAFIAHRFSNRHPEPQSADRSSIRGIGSAGKDRAASHAPLYGFG